MTDDIELERQAVEALKYAIGVIGDGLDYYWRWGDFHGGYVLDMLREEVVSRGHEWPLDQDSEPAQRKKDKISRKLSKSVFERDEYRCVTCGTHIDLTCDHIIPESRGGQTAFDNLQTMCRSCNCKKGAREQ